MEHNTPPTHTHPHTTPHTPRREKVAKTESFLTGNVVILTEKIKKKGNMPNWREIWSTCKEILKLPAGKYLQPDLLCDAIYRKSVWSPGGGGLQENYGDALSRLQNFDRLNKYLKQCDFVTHHSTKLLQKTLNLEQIGCFWAKFSKMHPICKIGCRKQKASVSSLACSVSCSIEVILLKPHQNLTSGPTVYEQLKDTLKVRS